MDISLWQAQMTVLTDGNGHFVTIIPFGDREALFYGDGETFYKLRSYSASSVGNERFSVTLGDPRYGTRDDPQVIFEEQQFILTCGDRRVPVQALPASEATALLEAGTFLSPRWERMAYFLARDDFGTYYYVDRTRDRSLAPDFRVYIGWQGQMSRAPLVGIAQDSMGEIYSTPGGDRRLIKTGDTARWIQEGEERQLTVLPVELNSDFIYNASGPYPELPFGTPCDDL